MSAIEQVPPNENELELDEENYKIEKWKISKITQIRLLFEAKIRKSKKWIMTHNRMQTWQQTRIQEELNNIDKESEPESE